MKNSLNRVLTAFDDIMDSETGECRCDSNVMAHLQYEARRINDNLIQLLMFYRNDHGLYHAQFAPVTVYELLEDCWLSNKPMMDHSGLQCTIQCDEELIWILDSTLIEAVIENVINNTVRYTRENILLSAELNNGWLEIRIEDDGPGYPTEMLGRRQLDDGSTVNRKDGRTGLGLYFCALVASSHSNDECTGWIELMNDSRLGGGCFLLRLPQLLNY
nr:HAMP domain-containing sensor histidine kinase [Thiospirillum jenense]